MQFRKRVLFCVSILPMSKGDPVGPWMSVLTQIPRLLALVVVAMTAACTQSDLGTEYAEITEAESGLIFHPPGLQDGYRRFISGQNASFDDTTIGVYGPPHGALPQAQIVIIETPPTRHFNKIPEPRSSLKKWNIFEDRTVVFGVTGIANNAIGRAKYAAFTADEMSCVTWTQGIDPRYDRSAGSHMLAGYFCRDGDAMTAAQAMEIISQVGHREYGIP